MKIDSLYYYPLKSGCGIKLRSAPINSTGIQNDRRWVLVDGTGRFITQRELPLMGKLLLQPSPDHATIHWNDQTVRVQRYSPDSPSPHQIPITVWKDKVLAHDCGDEIAEFLSSKLGRSVRLCEAFETRSIANKDIPQSHSTYFFADSYPFMILSQESIDDLNRRLVGQELPPVTLNRFRPNIVLKGLEPFAEDEIHSLHIGDNVELRFGKFCTRCNIVNIDPLSLETQSEPLKTLATYRKIQGSKINFGVHMWLVSGQSASIREGDPVRITMRS
jgi:uncharacterized protein YcbX